MIVSKPNLQVIAVASKDEFDQGLNGLRLEPDGTTVGGNSSREGVTMMAVSPAIRGKARIPSVGEEAEIPASGLVLDLSLVEDVIKNMPKVKRPELQYAVMTKHQDARRCEFTTNDMRKEKKVSDIPKMVGYPDWRKVLQQVVAGPNGEGAGDEESVARVCVNRKYLINLLKALEASCPDKGDYNPVWIELGKGGSGLMLRCVNWTTGQRAIGFIQAFTSREGWLEWSDWERKLWGVVKKVKKLLKRKKV